MLRIIVLVLLVAVAALLYREADAVDWSFRKNLAGEAFWILVGVIGTTFLLEALLRWDSRRTERRRDQFGFRNFAGLSLHAIAQVAGCRPEVAQPLFEAVPGKNRAFVLIVEAVAADIDAAGAVDPVAYDRQYAEIADRLRHIALHYVRLFSRTDREMVERYRQLEDLAQGWRYRETLWRAAEGRAPSRLADDAELARWTEKRNEELASVLALCRDSANHLLLLARTAAEPPIWRHLRALRRAA